MSNQTTCYICNEKVSFPCKNKHLFSKKHTQDIHSAILKRKTEFMTWIRNVEKKIVRPTPIIRFNARPYQICLVCKKISPNSDSYVNCPCGKNTENAQAIMDILESSNEPETVSEDNSELHSINKEQKALIEKLKAEVEKLKREKKELQAQAADAEEPYDCLYHILSHYQETNTDQFNDTFSLIKGNSYATTVSKLQKDLSLDEE